MPTYNHKTIEEKWVQEWIDKKIYSPDLEGAKKPYYNLMMFPYPSAEGLHVGNMYAFTGADVYGRYQRMKGFDVFEPIGLDGFGIHSENFAIKMGKHPAEMAKVSQERFYDQLKRIGAGFAWDHRLETYDPDYYKWTQWLFTQMFKRGLAYRKSAMVNWCPSCKTVLADEQVENQAKMSNVKTQNLSQDPSNKEQEQITIPVCERCKSEVGRKEMKQWFFRITRYAEELLANIEKIDWPGKIKIAQRNWIGKKEGIDIRYPVVGSRESAVEKQVTTITCFTTRPDTNFGVTFVVVAPEHELVGQILSGVINVPDNTKMELNQYVEMALNKTEQQRQADERKKTGVFLNLFAINQLNDYKMPIYVSDFVLKDFGTGAVVGVPGHDVRDFEFAMEFDLPVIRVVDKDGDVSEIKTVEQVQEEAGKMMNSQFLDGMDIHQATKAMMDHLEEKGWGKRETSYHLRDWLISRQRYWGPPIPMVYCETCAKEGKGEQRDMEGWYSVPDQELPVLLPKLDDYKPAGDGKAPLARAGDDFLYTKCPRCGGKAKRETDVSDTFLDSAWYYLRYPSVGTQNSKLKTQNEGVSDGLDMTLPWNMEITSRWLPVNTYIGGAEHAVLHLLYSRFVWMALRDWEFLPEKLGDEPFPFLFSHGLIVKDGAKMSKSRGNVVIPDEYIEKFGADTLRMYLMFLGPYDQGGDFRDSGMAGMYRFLTRVWQIMHDRDKVGDRTTPELLSKLHETIRKMDRDLGIFKFNTAIAALMELVNVWRQGAMIMSREDKSLVIKLLSPLAPMMSEELWQEVKGKTQNSKIKTGESNHYNNSPTKSYKGGNDQFRSVHLEKYPTFDPQKISSAGVLVVIQVNGKKRGELVIPFDQAEDGQAIISQAKEASGMDKWLAGEVKKEVFVPGKGERQGVVNFVV